MPMTAAERQKKYIEKLKRENPEKYEDKRKNHLQKVKDRQKKVKSLTDEEKQNRKEKNNATKTKQPKQDKEQEEILKNNIELRRKNSVLEKKVTLLNKQIKTLKKTINRYKFKVNNLRSKIEAYDDLRLIINDEQVQNRDSELQLVNAATPLTRASSFVDETLPSISYYTGTPKFEKEMTFEMKTDNKEEQTTDDIIKQHESGVLETKREKRLEMKTDTENRAADDIINENESEVRETEKGKRLKIVKEERKIPKNESEIPESIHYLARSSRSEMNENIETTSDEPCNTSIKPGKFILAKFSNKRNKEYQFVCGIEDISHNKIVVQGFKSKNKKSIYVTIKNDISIIENEDIIEFLSQPEKEGNYYVFSTDINVKEI